jgi:plastocyanin
MKPGLNMTLGAVLFLVAFGISAPVLYGASQLIKTEDAGGADAGAGGGGATGGPVTVNIAAQNLQFSVRQITASPGVEVTVVFENREAVPHNVAFYTNRSATSSIFKGELITGPRTVTNTFTAPASPGSYFFRCDAHPDTMTGTFTVQ